MANGKAGAPEGNQNATKQNRLITDTFRRIATQNPDKVRKACEKVLDSASEGDLAAFREMTDRLDGKAVQSIEAKVEAKMSITISPDDTEAL